MKLLRSEEMSMIQLFIQSEAAHSTLDELGEMGCVEFRDFNIALSAFQRQFVGEVKRCDELQRKLRFFEEQVDKANTAAENEENQGAATSIVEDLQGNLEILRKSNGSANRERFQDLEGPFEQYEKELLELQTNLEGLRRSNAELQEHLHVLRKDSLFFESSEIEDSSSTTVVGGANSTINVGAGGKPRTSSELPLVDEAQGTHSGAQVTSLFGFITGTLAREKFLNFEKILWRTTRGNLFMRFAEIQEEIVEPHTGVLLHKNVFIIFFQGERIKEKITKICESFGANMYDCPSNHGERRRLLEELSTRLSDLKTVMTHTVDLQKRTLLAVQKNLVKWNIIVSKEKAIYITMNKLKVNATTLVAEGWCPKNTLEQINMALQRANEKSGASLPCILNVLQTKEKHPTFFDTDKVTTPFQLIVDAYGTARYREVNPTIFTVITFPFLFALMFGDIGHGILLFATAVYLVVNEKKIGQTEMGEMSKTLYDGRYVLLLMGIFSVYVGLIYNECFALTLDLFGTTWEFKEGSTTGEIMHPNPHIDNVYPIGIDPVWLRSSNSLEFYNSVKMKLSIIFGVTQMLIGLGLSLLNHLYFGKKHVIYLEWIPQVIFMSAMFGYMVLIIFIKWSIDWKDRENDAPSLVQTMIDMFLSSGYASDYPLYSGQLGFQKLIVVVALLCIPWMLLGKPLYMKYLHGKSSQANDHQKFTDEDSNAGDSQGHGHTNGGEDHGDGEHGEEGFSFSDEMIHQVIHTIEYVLGTVSNTASYLRLWALSLAHSELSLVFWEQIMARVLEMNFVATFLGTIIWFGATLGVLMIMESLSAFLHALRLHWVEFQSKFYAGDGKQFLPFNYKKIIQTSSTSKQDDD